MKIKTPQSLLILLISALLFSCQSGDVASLQAENEELKKALDEKQDEFIELDKIADDYRSQINNLKDELFDFQDELDAKAEPKYPQEYVDLINRIHGGWEALATEKSKDKLIANFLPDFSVNGVQLSSTPWVGQGTENFFTYLDRVAAGPDWNMSVGDVKILYLDRVGNLFTLALRTKITVYIDGEEASERPVIEVLTGKNEDGLKVGNYSWVSLVKS